jgi:hypothetical protein
MGEAPMIDDHGYPTPAGMIALLRSIAEGMPFGKERNDLHYTIGYVKHSMGLPGDEE